MKLQRRVLIGSGILAAAMAVAPKALARGRVEEPAYTVVAKMSDFEVREYAPRIVAETTVVARPGEAGNRAFRILANYIFGANQSKAEIAMTAPVATQAAAPKSQKIEMTAPVTEQAGPSREDGMREYMVTFTMPSEWTMATLPEPNDSRVKLRELPKRRFAAVRFNGSPGPEYVAQRERALLDAVEEAGLSRADAAPIYARYDPPWTPGFFRRNEILVELR